MATKKLLAAAAGVIAGALALSACAPTPQATQSAAAQTSASVAWNQAFYSYNSATSFGNATANANIIYLTNDTFSYYDKELKPALNTSFGTYEKVSDAPLTIKQTLAATATWSDGVPVTPADLVLTWGAGSGHFNNYKAKTDAETGNVSGGNKDGKVFFNADIPNLTAVKDFPVIDGSTITYTYAKTYVDWEVPGVLWNPGVPAHVVGKRALGITDPAQAAQAVSDAFKNKDNAALSKISNVWNTDFNFKDMPTDKELVLGTGPYTITDLKPEYVTLTKNPNYKGEHKPSIQTITVRIIPDAQGSVQALQNGEVLATQPQATADILKQMQALQNVTVTNGTGGTYEHVDMAENNKGPFDPAAYGGDADKARKVRQAFLYTIPRQAIVDTIIKPLNPDAKVRSSFTVVPGSPNYDAMVAANGMDATFGLNPDIEKAKALLAEAGEKTPTVRFLDASNNPRRVQEFQLIKESAEKAGFKMVDTGNENWGGMLGDTSKYDAALFGWQSTSVAVGESEATYRTGGGNNFYGYSNKKVDELFAQLQSELDPAKQKTILEDVEKILVEDAFGTTIFQFPQPTAVSKRLTGFSDIPLSPNFFWNFWEWKLA